MLGSEFLELLVIIVEIQRCK